MVTSMRVELVVGLEKREDILNLFYAWLKDVKETKRKALVEDIFEDSTTTNFISSPNLPSFAEKIKLPVFYTLLFISMYG